MGWESVVKIAQSVQLLSTGWSVRGSNPGRGKVFINRTLELGSNHLFLQCVTGPFLGRKVAYVWHRPRVEVLGYRKGRDIPLLLLWDLKACWRVNFTFLSSY